MKNSKHRKNGKKRIANKNNQNSRNGRRVLENLEMYEESADVNARNNRANKGRQLKRDGKKIRKKDSLSDEERLRKKRRRKRRLIFILIILIILLVMFLVSLYKWNKIMKDVIRVENSVVLDSTGNVIAVLGESRIQETVGLDRIPQNLINAYVSIEDKNFYKHHGINFKRTAGAIASYIVHRGSASYGGSTITQQLVKNVTGDNQSSISRKVIEWDRAIKTEFVLSKDEILQTYLNIIYVGPNVYGVEMGSRYYFNKSVSDLDLAECAFLAGLNHSPNSYNPFGETDNSEKIKNRATTVLNVMLEENYINSEQYQQAVEELENGLKFEKGDVKPKGDGVYSYMVDATISEVIEDLKEEKKMSTTFATNYLYFSGMKIYCTQNSEIQKDMEDEFSKNKYKIKSEVLENVTSQAAMVIMDHNTGYIMACVRRGG